MRKSKTDEVTLKPVFSRILIRVIEQKLSEILEVVQYKSTKEPLALVEILDFGNDAGKSDGRVVVELKVGMKAYVYTQAITTHYLPSGEKICSCPDDKIFAIVVE